MTVQAGLCRTCSETTLLVFLRGGSNVFKLDITSIKVMTSVIKCLQINRLRRNDRAMIRWICNVKANDEVSSDSLLSKLGLQDIDVVLRSSRMRWYGHVERSKGWIAQVRKLNIVAQKRSGKPRKSWDEVLLDDRKTLGMDTADPQNRSEWRGRLRRRLVKQVQPSVEDNGL